MRTVIVFVLGCVVGVAGDAPAEACTLPLPAPIRAIPSPGATDVSTATSIFILGDAHPTQLRLEANGAVVPTEGLELIGHGRDGLADRWATFWRVRGIDLLAPDTTYVLSALTQAVPVELTRFTTGPGYEKDPGVGPHVTALRLWRVRYPVELIGAGSCVFAEFHGFLETAFEPAPPGDTPPEDLVHHMVLTPRHGGTRQGFVMTGPRWYLGQAPTDGLGPTPGTWSPDFEPDREYCVQILAFGYGDRARSPAWSNELCASVTAGGGSEGGCRIGSGGPAPRSSGFSVVALIALGAGLRCGRGRRRARTLR